MTFLLILAGGLVLLDQLAKYFLTQCLLSGESLPLIKDFFELTLVYNSGGVFGLGRGAVSPYFFIFLSSLAVVLILIFRRELSEGTRSGELALGLILGGALGNLIDRARLGAVIDFLDFSFRAHHWPAFNLADAGICLGVAILIWKYFQKSAKRA